MYVARKDPTLLLTRKLCTARKRVQSNLVLKLQSESQRKLVPRNTATFAGSMGAHTGHTILEIAIGLRKTERKNPISGLLSKAERNPIPQSSFAQLNKKLDQLEKVTKKKDTKKRKHHHSNSDSDFE